MFITPRDIFLDEMVCWISAEIVNLVLIFSEEEILQYHNLRCFRRTY